MLINYTLFLVSNNKLAVEASAISNQIYFKNFLNESDSYEINLTKNLALPLYLLN